MFGLIAATGLRINEALKLDDDDLDLDAGVITVKRGKNGRARFVPITAMSSTPFLSRPNVIRRWAGDVEL